MCLDGRYGCIPSSNGVGPALQSMYVRSRAQAYAWSLEQKAYPLLKLAKAAPDSPGNPMGPDSRTISIRTGSCGILAPQ
jgi:hypothetical protein